MAASEIIYMYCFLICSRHSSGADCLFVIDLEYVSILVSK